MGLKVGKWGGILIREWLTDSLCVLARQTERRKRADKAHRFEADRNDLADPADDISGIVLAIGVVGDAAAYIG